MYGGSKVTSYVMYIIYKHCMITACMMLCDALFHDNITRTCHLITSCLLFLENMIQQSLCVVFFDEKKTHYIACDDLFHFYISSAACPCVFYSLVSVT